MYKYEMHQHTWPCSHCGRADPAELVRVMKRDGFAGCVLTNHFLHGNTGIDRALPWADFVRAYEEDWLIANAEGEKLDFDVIFGIEEHVGGGKEILLYGITPQFLYDRPELASGDLETFYNACEEVGALVFQAHPFRHRDYIEDPDTPLPVRFLHGIEAYNGSNKPGENPLARAFAEENGMLMSAGSDAHREEYENRFGIECAHRIRTPAQLAGTLRRGDYSLLLPSLE